MAEHQLHSEPRGEAAARSLHAEVHDVLSRVARAVTSGDGAAMAALWEVPAFVIGADSVMAIERTEQISKFFGGAKQQYNDRGIVDTRPDIRGLERIGDRMVIASVRWPYLDAAGKVVGAESSDYTLRRDDTGAFKIRCVLMRGVEHGAH